MKSRSGVGALKLSATFPPRPGHGTLGQKLTVYANYFELRPSPKLSLTRYNVEVAPEEKGKKLKRIFELLLEKPEFAGVASEFKSLIISRQPLNIPDGYTTEILYLAEDQDEPRSNAKTYKVRVVTPTTLAIDDLMAFLGATSNATPAFDQKYEAIQALNVLLGNHPNVEPSVVSIGQNRHFSLNRQNQNVQALGGGLESLRGFFQSIRAATGRMLINVNVSHGVFLQPDLLSNLYPQLGTGARHTLQTKIKRMRVYVIHLPPNVSKKTGKEIPRVKTVFGLAHTADGNGSEHAPQVVDFAAGPKGVKFWLADVPPTAPPGTKPPAKGKKPAGKGLPTNQYISVWDYFKHSKSAYLQ